MADLAHWAAETPDAFAVIAESGTRTFAELEANVNRLARALRSRGLAAGDAVALIAGNHPAFVETFAACIRAGFQRSGAGMTAANRAACSRSTFDAGTLYHACAAASAP